MSPIEWSYKYEVRIKQFDDEHRELAKTLATLETALEAGKPADELLALFLRLVAQAREHFRSEEVLLAEYAYPGLNKQRDEHESFLKRLSDVEQDLRKGITSVDQNLIESTAKWFSEHMLGVDFAYAEFLKSHGVK